MTKAERRIEDFSLGLKKLSDDSRKYICKLAQILFLVEQLPHHPNARKKTRKSKITNM